MERLGAGNRRASVCTRIQWSQMHTNDTWPPKIHSWFISSCGKSRHTSVHKYTSFSFPFPSALVRLPSILAQTIFVPPASCIWFVLARIYIYIVNRVHCISSQCPQCMEKNLKKKCFPHLIFSCGGQCPACTRVSFLNNFCFIFILLSLPYLSALLFFSLISFSISPPSPPACRLTACLPTWVSAGRTSALTLKIPTWNASPWRSRRRSEWQCFESLGLSKSLFFLLHVYVV